MTGPRASASTPQDYVKKLAEKIHDYFNQPARHPLPSELAARFPGFAELVRELRAGKYPARAGALKAICSHLENGPEPSKLQQSIAYLVNYAPSRWLLEHESQVVCQRRDIHSRKYTPWDRTTESIYQWASSNSLSGLCMSGGGIRSATFNLGILQGLASKRWIGSFDYISSVSGGGYIHSWFAAWLMRTFDRRCKAEGPFAAGPKMMREALSQVEASLTPLPQQPTKWTWRAPAFKGEDLGPMLPGTDFADSQKNSFWPSEIKWLRSYSNYLTPKTGLFTMDTWAAFSIWLRNTFLNQLVLMAILVAFLCLPHLLSDHWQPPASTPAPKQKSELELKGTASTTGMGQLTSLSFSLNGKPETPDAAKMSWHRFTYDFAEQIRAAVPARWRPQAAAACPPLDSLKIDGPECPCANPAPPLWWAAVKKIVTPWWIFLGLCVAGVITFAFAAWLFKATLSAEWDRVHLPHFEDRKGETSEKVAPRTLREAAGIKLLSAVALLALSGVPFFYWILYNPYLDWKTPVVIFLMYTGLGLCGAFGTKPIQDLAVYGMEGRPGTHEGPREGTDASSEKNPSDEPRAEDAKRDEKSPEGGFWKDVTDANLLRVWLIASSILAALLGTLAFVAVAALIKTVQNEQWGSGVIPHAVPAVEMVFGIPMLMWLPFFTVILVAGLVGHFFEDWMLELIARARARSILIAGGAFLLLFVALLSPGLSALALGGVKLKLSAAIAWVATTLAGVFSGKSDKTDGKPPSSGDAKGKTAVTPELLATVGPYIYVSGLFVVLSALVQPSLGACGNWPVFFATILSSGLIAIAFGRHLDATKFSMYPFYRDRLTRCYLGASNRERMPSPLTGFDNRDTRGLQLKNFTPEKGYAGPIPIFCATLNLTTGGDLATQERKGASFAFTPLYSGYTVSWTEGKAETNFNGFVPTSEYAVPGGLNIAAAMAISGAALSPNWGFHSKPATAFLLTMFNARLGRWLPNPRKPSATRPKSIWRGFPGLIQLIRELFGNSDDASEYVYLSDGGHFDNMGLYELVRRHCHRIVICDAEEDSGYVFSGIGMAIRKCRIDFGVEIELNLSDLRLVAKTKFSAAHIARGFITYPDTPDKRGEILYVKSSLVSFPSNPAQTSKGGGPGDLPDAPGDVQNYWLEHGTFPHDSTVNQWFTESQFESYRRLGQCVVESIQGTLF